VSGFYKRRVHGTLKAAEAALVEACGGINARVTRVGKTVLQAATDPDQPARHLALDVVADLERHCGKPIATRFLAGELGCVVEPVPCLLEEPVAVVVGRITKETGELLAAAASDVARGTLTRANAAMILRETDDVLAALVELRSGARAVLEGGGA
jgi:hypothetical protein